MTTNISLRGIKEYAHTKNSSQSNSFLTDNCRHLRDLETLVNNMYYIRETNTSSGCSSHGSLGNESTGSCPSVTTPVCNGHSNLSSLYTGKLSLGAILNALLQIKGCTCDSQTITGCQCVSYCPCVSRCGCQSRCPCDCDHCACNCAQSGG